MRLVTIAVAVIGLNLGASAQLHELAKKAGLIYFGTATDNGELSNKKYFDILTDKKEFGQLTPSNGQKWFAVEPEQGVFNYSMGSVVADLAKKNGQILRCHNLVWHSQLAPWVTSTSWTKETLTAALINHVSHEAAHWAGKCYAWDVLNEALNEDGTYRNTTFYHILGPSYIPLVFAVAAKADPKAKLYYNDYNIEGVGAKSNAVRDLIVAPLKKAGVKIDGVGLQAHFVVGGTPAIDDMILNMNLFTKMGVEVALTELDIRLDEPETAAKLTQQSKDYEAAVGACVQVKKCVGITVWDFYDPFSWVPGVFTGQGSATLYFSNFTKHPAYYGVVKALKNETDCGKDKGAGKGWKWRA